MAEGIVYVLTNPAMPGMVKIGKTGRDVELRLNDLYTTGLPCPSSASTQRGFLTWTGLKTTFTANKPEASRNQMSA